MSDLPPELKNSKWKRVTIKVEVSEQFVEFEEGHDESIEFKPSTAISIPFLFEDKLWIELMEKQTDEDFVTRFSSTLIPPMLIKNFAKQIFRKEKSL